jgi:RimJ/RimL family protein N-acetyltransferase
MYATDVYIRPYTLEDAALIVEAVLASVGQLQPWMTWGHPAYGLAESRTWLKAQVAAFEQRTAFEFAIVSKEGHYLGGCGLNQIDIVNRRANLGYWVRTDAAGRGAATAAVGLLRQWAFRHTDLERLEIVVAVGNLASQRVAAKSGATREGTLRRRLRLHGRQHDAALFALVRNDGVV